MFKCLQIMCAKYYDFRYVFKKIAPHQNCRVLLDTTSKFTLFSVSGLKVEKLIKKSKPT